MLEFAARLFDPTDFTPRANCGPGWTPALIWLHVAGDLFIWLAYVSIPLLLLYFVRRHEAPFPRLFFLFALFILACGFGHFLEALMFEYPHYRLAGAWKAVTATVSWATVVAMVVVSPRLMVAIGAFHGERPPAPAPAPAATSDTALHRLTVPVGRAHVNDYIVGVLAAVLALLVRAAIDPLVNTDHFYALSLLAVVFVSWQGGFGPALVALLLSMAGMVYFFIPPTRSFVVEGFSNQLATAVFFFCGVCCAALGEAQRRARMATKAALAVALEQKDTLAAEVGRRRAAEADLRESEARFRTLADSAPALIWVGGPDGARTYFNRTWLEFTGRPLGEQVGEGWVEAIHPDDRGRYLREYHAGVAGRRSFEIEYRLRRHDGEARWVLARGVPRFAPDGTFLGLVGLCLDVTDRKAAAEQLRESEERLRLAVDIAQMGTFEIDLATDAVAVNEQGREIYGWADARTTFTAVQDHFHPDDKAEVMRRVGGAFDPAGPGTFEVEQRIVRADGAVRWIRVRGRALFAGGRAARCLGSYLDVTDQRRAAESLRESEARFRTLAEAVPQIVWVTRPDGYHEYYNPKWYEYTGMTEAESVGFGWSTPLHPDDKARAEARWKRSTDTGREYDIEYRFRGRDGAYRWFLGRALPQRDAAGNIVRWFGTCTDIHDAKLAADALRASEERFRTLTEAIPQIVWNAGAGGDVTYLNRRWREYTGLDFDEARGRDWLDAVHPDERDQVSRAWRGTVESAAVGSADRFVHELRLRHGGTGEYRWFLTVAVPLRRPDGSIDQWIGSMADIHDQKTAAGLVEEANHFLEATINALPSHIAVLDRDGTILKVNDAWRQFGDENGLRLDEHGVGSNYLAACDVVCSTDPDLQLSDGIQAVIAGHRAAYRIEYPCHSPKDRRWFQMRVTRFPGDGPVRVVVAHENITHRVLAELAVRESEEKFRTMAESIPQLAWMADADGYIFWYNQRWYDYTGKTPEEMRGWGWRDVHDPAVLPDVMTRWRASLDTGEPFDMVFPLRGADGTFRPFLTRVNPIRDDGKVTRWFGTNTDVTAQRRMEQALRDAAERFRTLTEAVPQMVWTADAKGELTFFNRRWDEYTGRPLAAGREWDWWAEVIHPDDIDEVRAEWQSAVDGQPDLYTVEFRLRRTDGAYRWMLSTAVPLRAAAGGVAEWVGSITDIDDQKRYAETLERTVRDRTATLLREVEERTRAEAEVRKQREFLGAILANVADGIVACDETGALTLLNRAAQEFHGLPAEPLPPDQWAGRYDLYRADGETPLPTDEIPLFRALRGERVRDAEMVIAPHDLPPRILVANGQRLSDADGRNLGAVVSMRDVTEQREADRQLAEAAAELRRANAELARSNGELEQFAYVASHDLQEPLRKIQAFGDRLATKCRDQLPDTGKEYVDRMLVSAGRMRRLIDDLLTFSRVTTQARPFAPLDLGKLVREVAADVSERIEKTGGEVRVGELPAIDADPTQIRQLFQNLIVNAIKFHRPGVPPVVDVSGEVVSESGAGGEPERVCRIAVRDNGIGFDEKYLDRIFQVFQRLHGREEYEGTGVGLAICRKITDRHGGTITARSRPGEGATFIVTLPIRHPNPPDA